MKAMKKETAMTIALFGFLVSLSSVMCPCICGHLSLNALPSCVIGVLLVLWAFSRVREPSWGQRIATDVILIITTLILLKCVGDILWFGHNPVFANPFWLRW